MLILILIVTSTWAMSWHKCRRKKRGEHLMLSRDEGSKFLHQLCRHFFFCEVVPVRNSSVEKAVSVGVFFGLPKEKQRLLFLLLFCKLYKSPLCPSCIMYSFREITSSSCSPCQTLVAYGNTQITKRALKLLVKVLVFKFKLLSWTLVVLTGY